MLAKRTFGKLGKRAAARLATQIDGGLETPGHSAGCRVENLSRSGCRLHLDKPPGMGVTVLVRIERIEALGHVAWVREDRCGVTFSEALEQSALERVRWMVDNAEAHAENKRAVAIAMWR